MPVSITRCSILLLRPEMPPYEVATLTDPLQAFSCLREVDGFRVRVTGVPGDTFTALEVALESPAGPAQGYLAVQCDAPHLPCTFLGDATGIECYRQSPHDPADHVVDLAKQAIPMAGFRDGEDYLILVSDTPATCDNYTTQHVDPAQGVIRLTSGDDGAMPGYRGKLCLPYYHTVAPDRPHVFRLLAFRTQASDLPALRRETFTRIAARWGESTSRFHALCFATNYMHYRRNETGYSDYWVVPGIEYANKQYTRDAFWQSLILPPAMEQQCYDAVYEERYKYAENGLLFLLWSARLQARGGRADLARAADALAYVEAHVTDGAYVCGPESKPTLRSWYDLCAFEDEDVVTYNQGLLPVALLAARALGLPTRLSLEQATAQYRALFREEEGYFPVSRRKAAFAVDGLAGDLLAQVYFNTALLADAPVHRHFARMHAAARTPYGYKVTCAEDGAYLPAEAYGARGYLSEGFGPKHGRPGRYQWGGSWYLYDMQGLLACYLHGAPGAEEAIIDRTALEIRLGGTYHEYIDTRTGEPNKPNQGWNAAIYALWATLMAQGRATDRFFQAMESML